MGLSGMQSINLSLSHGSVADCRTRTKLASLLASYCTSKCPVLFA